MEITNRVLGNRVTAAMLVVGIALWAFAPTLAIWWVQREARAASLIQPREVYVQVERNDTPSARTIVVALRWSSVPFLIAPNWSGTVDAVPVRSGTILRDGSPVVSIDGITRRAYHTKRPFTRTIRAGDEGADVRQLNSLLRRLGLAHGAQNVATAATIRGVAQLARQLGVLGSIDAFDPAWVIYLPTGMSRVSGHGFVLGAPAPAAGARVVTGSTSPVAGTFFEAVGSMAGTASGSGSSLELGPPVVVRPAESLSWNETTLGVDHGGKQLSEAGLKAIAAKIADHPTKYVEADLLSAPAAGSFVLPAAAVVSDGSRTCLATRADQSIRAIPIEVAGTENGRVIVIGELELGMEVAIPAPKAFRCE